MRAGYSQRKRRLRGENERNASKEADTGKASCNLFSRRPVKSDGAVCAQRLLNGTIQASTVNGHEIILR